MRKCFALILMVVVNFRCFVQPQRFAWNELSSTGLKVCRQHLWRKHHHAIKVCIYIKISFLASVVTTVQRDCAPQKYISHDYNHADKTWYKKHEVITTAYDEGCFIGEHRGAPTAPPEYCFCSFYLCNSSPSQSGIFNKAYEIILALLIMRLL